MPSYSYNQLVTILLAKTSCSYASIKKRVKKPLMMTYIRDLERVMTTTISRRKTHMIARLKYYHIDMKTTLHFKVAKLKV